MIDVLEKKIFCIEKNQKQTMSLSTLSTEGGMYNKFLLRVCQEGCIKICYINV